MNELQAALRRTIVDVMLAERWPGPRGRRRRVRRAERRMACEVLVQVDRAMADRRQLP